MEKFELNTYYHIYNRANGDEKLFRSDANYRYFLRQYVKYIEPIAVTYAWYLLPNHFHFLIRLQKNLEGLGTPQGLSRTHKALQGLPGNLHENLADLGTSQGLSRTQQDLHGLPSNFQENLTCLGTQQGLSRTHQALKGLVSQRFSNFFNSYSKAFNQMYHRKGSLFMRNMKRKAIETDEHLKKIVCYIHHNPVHHSIVKNMMDWSYSSYSLFLAKDEKDQVDSGKQKVGLLEPVIPKEEVLKWFGGKENFISCHQESLKIKLLNRL